MLACMGGNVYNGIEYGRVFRQSTTSSELNPPRSPLLHESVRGVGFSAFGVCAFRVTWSQSLCNNDDSNL